MGPERGSKREERNEAQAGGGMRFEDEQQNGETGVKWGGRREEGKWTDLATSPRCSGDTDHYR